MSAPENPNSQQATQGADKSVSRRGFMKKTAVAGTALGAATLPIPNVLGAEPRNIRVGVIGCGGRGTGAASNAVEAGKITGDNVTINAVADLFPDKLVRVQRKYKVPAEKSFSGFDAYEKLVQEDLDYVILATPPHFRPAMFEAAIAAGKNVFTEKPVAVDAPGIRRFLLGGYLAKLKGLSVAAGTQRRHQKQYIEANKRIRDGAIGQVVAGRCYWNQGGLWSVEQQEGWTDMEWQIRDWLYFTWLSGDHIVEQHVHNLDVLNWFIGSHPIAARGMGGREVRDGKKKYGNIFDHFATELIYASPDPKNYPDIRVTSMARQIAGCWNDVSEFIVGTKGSSNCSSVIHGPNEWRWDGKQVNPYIQEHVDLINSMKAGNGELNETENVATSTMTAIMARESCYTGREVRWDELLKSDVHLGPKEYAFGDAPAIEVPRPGKPM